MSIKFELRSRNPKLMPFIIFCGFVAVTVLETQLPRATAPWVLYIPLLTLSLFLQNLNFPMVLATMSSFWLILDLIFLEAPPISSAMVIRRALGTITFFSVAYIVRFAIRMKLNEEMTQRELERTANALAKEQAKLEKSNRELEQFAGVAAHDLRSPIKTLRSWLDMTMTLIPSPRSSELDQALRIIQENAKRADDLVGDVLQIARVNVAVSNVGTVDLNRTLREVLLDLQQEIKSVKAQIHIGPLPTVAGNKSYLGSIFSNLIRNALIYREKSRPLEVSVGFREQTGNFEFFVKDNGIGIEPKYSERIFQMFNRLHHEKDYPGTGIGLAFCKKVVELNGGKIWVDSVPGSGSTFFFTYPKKFKGGLSNEA